MTIPGPDFSKFVAAAFDERPRRRPYLFLDFVNAGHLSTATLKAVLNDLTARRQRPPRHETEEAIAQLTKFIAAREAGPSWTFTA
jgi:hypothetical protein